MDSSGQRRPVAVVAVGGNSLIKDAQHTSMLYQYEAVVESMSHVAAMIAEGWNVVVTHGNGPQVGFLLRRSELAANELHTVPLDVLGADTQGAIGYMFCTALHNEFARLGLDERAVSVITQTVVDRDDPAFQNPSKPIGSFLTKEQARVREADDGWSVAEDAGRGWRRVVASPTPVRIVELEAIRSLVETGYTVIAAGGGGIPVIENSAMAFEGVEAVIDKDFGSAILARELGAELLLISTAVDQVAINFGTPQQEWLSRLTVAEAVAYQLAGHFAKGSMGPKLAAAIAYLEGGGKKVIITSPAQMVAALRGEAGTTIVP